MSADLGYNTCGGMAVSGYQTTCGRITKLVKQIHKIAAEEVWFKIILVLTVVSTDGKSRFYPIFTIQNEESNTKSMQIRHLTPSLYKVLPQLCHRIKQAHTNKAWIYNLIPAFRKIPQELRLRQTDKLTVLLHNTILPIYHTLLAIVFYFQTRKET